MKTFTLAFFVLITALLTSCMTLVHTQKTYPPELALPQDSCSIIFINFYDYTLAKNIKDKQEFGYRLCIRGFSQGLKEGFVSDSSLIFSITDTLARNYTVMSMQDSSFRDTTIAICRRHDADLLIALDSINVWLAEELVEDEDESLTSEYYLYSSSYLTLYSSNGEVIDRSTAEESRYYKSRPAFFGGLITFSPSMTKAAIDAAALTLEAGRQYAARFFPATSMVDVQLYRGALFDDINEDIINGKTVLAIEPLRKLTGSSKKSVARKAAHNLSVVYQIMDDRRTTDEVISDFKGKK